MNTLILDLDETLIYCAECVDSAQSLNSLHEIDLASQQDFYNLQISLRPGLNKFLKCVSELFEVLVFTASKKQYALQIVKLIDPEGIFIDGVLSREDCQQYGELEFIKDLSCLDREEGSVVILDNSLGAVKQLESLIPIVSYYGDEMDKQLQEVLPYLRSLAKEKNIVDKNEKTFGWNIFKEAATCLQYFQTIRKNYKNSIDIIGQQ